MAMFENIMNNIIEAKEENLEKKKQEIFEKNAMLFEDDNEANN